MRLLVARDGSGDCATIGEALDLLRAWQGAGRVEVQIASGVYREKLVVDIPSVTLRGSGAAETVIVYGDSAHMRDAQGEEYGTFRTATVRVSADDVMLENLTVENDAGPGDIVEQAVAAYIAGDRTVLRGCRLLGYQDTLLLGPDWYNPREVRDEGRRAYLEDCAIEGNFDFIFGSYRTWFERCRIHCRAHPSAIITAPNSPKGQPFGFVFHDCTLSGECASQSVYLGRPWRPFGKAAFIRCDFGGQIRPEGWLDWEEPYRAVHDGLCEYACTGIAVTGRHPEAAVLRAADGYTIENVLDGWMPG